MKVQVWYRYDGGDEKDFYLAEHPDGSDLKEILVIHKKKDYRVFHVNPVEEKEEAP